MQLNKFDSAWNQLKCLSAMQHIDAQEILAIIENPEHTDRSKLQRVLINAIVFVVITMFCQGG